MKKKKTEHHQCKFCAAYFQHTHNVKRVTGDKVWKKLKKKKLARFIIIINYFFYSRFIHLSDYDDYVCVCVCIFVYYMRHEIIIIIIISLSGLSIGGRGVTIPAHAPARGRSIEVWQRRARVIIIGHRCRTPPPVPWRITPTYVPHHPFTVTKCVCVRVSIYMQCICECCKFAPPPHRCRKFTRRTFIYNGLLSRGPATGSSRQ